MQTDHARLSDFFFADSWLIMQTMIRLTRTSFRCLCSNV